MTPEELAMHTMKRLQAREECKQIHTQLFELETALTQLRADFDTAHKKFAYHDRIIANHEGKIRVIPVNARRRTRPIVVVPAVVLDIEKMSLDDAASLLAQLTAKMGITLSPEEGE
jgi:hypothetical protein